MRSPFQWLRRLFKRNEDSVAPAREDRRPSNPFLPPGDEYQADIGIVLDDYMVKNRPFLLTRYTATQLANDSGVPAPDLIDYIECLDGSNFRDYINSYRIRYCLDLLKKIPVKNFTLFDLSILCGFNDQQEFTGAFKRVTGVSATTYIKNEFSGRFPVHNEGAEG
jgi:AraC-like DNA-binding protein